VHVERVVCMRRRGGEIGDGDSGLRYFYTCRGVECVGSDEFLGIWVGIVGDDCELEFIIMSVLFWLCGLWVVR
jgi:hypothetical protein